MSRKKKKITFKDILHVLHADLIGKDSHRGITLTYGWMANQVGHFALGFIPTFIVFKLTDNLLKSVISVALFWLAFEIYNALSPLYKKEYKGNGTFRIPWKNLLFDTFTDLCFFWMGCFSFYLLMELSLLLLAIYLFAGGLLLFSIRFWFLTKLHQQNAILPYQFRLSQWDAPIDSKSSEAIKNYLEKPELTTHFIVIGANGSGKTRLSVGIANELAIRHRLSTYTTFSKLCSLFQDDDATTQRNNFSLWTWTESDFLLCDDINPGQPKEANQISVKDVRKFREISQSVRNYDVLKNTSVAWVIGALADGDTVDAWKEFIEAIGIEKEQIKVIDLNAAIN